MEGSATAGAERVHVAGGRDLVTRATSRVLVINGTVGAGKTTVAAAVSDLLFARGLPHAWVDVDDLCRAWPLTDRHGNADRYGSELAFAALTALAPVHAAAGYRHIVLARVVEEPAERERYVMAYGGAEVRIVRVTADEETRVERLTAREPAGPGREWHLARTVELEAVLVAAGVDDAVISADGRPPAQLAEQVLAAAGW